MSRNAVILVDKASGITSFDCLGRIKRNVNKKTGHCGTLDKFAHGLMVVLSGSYTHLVPAFMGLDKTYEAVIEFGKMTDTLDPEGEVIETGDIPSADVVRQMVEKLVGEQMQVPPAYSAIHVNGVRSYQLARSGDDMVELKARKIIIHHAQLISYEAPYLKVRLEVSKGTYIRSYARDIGHMCNSCAYVKELYRTKIGPFSIEDSIAFDDVDAMKNLPDGELLIRRLPGTVELEMDSTEAFKAANGYVMPSIKSRLKEMDARFAILKRDQKTVCIYSVSEGKILCQVRDGE
ncbi:MAG: tRNA pseudouridine(55) synthase TruB [Sphaerochaetaceae bacterium]|nr:tRNA pseudouridine(55) synthase TruB [Sphaerochaetaceae bacterium]